MSTYLFLGLVIICVLKNEAAKILAVFPTPSISHQVVFRPLTEELAKRGHEVTVVTPDPAFPKGKSPENLTEIDVHDFSYKVWREHIFNTTTGKKQDLYNQVRVAVELAVILFEAQMKYEEVQRILNDESKKYDLLLLEAWVKPTLALSYKYKVPVIQVSSFGAIAENYEVIGAPIHPILYPHIYSQKSHNDTLWNKIMEIYNYQVYLNIIKSLEDKENESIRRIFGPDVPSLSELSDNVDMLFLNTYSIWDNNRPVPPTVIYMGALQIKPENELPKDLKSYLDSSKKEIIYMSFGTNVAPSLLPLEKIQVILKVFSQLPYNVLWKWDKDDLPGKSDNIRISKWFPQSDLLRHPNVKLFITQGGLQSTDEAIAAGVPLIGFPMLGDQWYNVENYVHHGIGLRIDIETLEEEQLRNAIITVIQDRRFKNNIDKLRYLMLDQPQSALERAVWWTEYVLRHSGAKHLRPSSANISWTQYLQLDLLIVLLLSLVILFIVLLFGSYVFYQFVYKNVPVKIKVN